MKTSSIAKLALGLTLVSLSAVAMAAPSKSTGISTTKHNLGGTRGVNTHPNFTSSTTEICVFCHTPHGADSSAAVPLWNRQLGNATYNTYASLGTSTLDAESTDVGSVSLACLSCHDGTQAMNVVINSPGSGTTGDVNVALDANDVPYYISTASTSPAGVNCNTPGSPGGNCGGFGEFNMMSQVSGEMIYLSTDLRNDHPISIQYAGAVDGRAALDPDFNAASSSLAASGTTVWYIDAFGTTQGNGKQKSDLPLYNRQGGLLDLQPLVECATCHDPHSTNTTFLRNPAGNDGSATCLTCHDK